MKRIQFNFIGIEVTKLSFFAALIDVSNLHARVHMQSSEYADCSELAIYWIGSVCLISIYKKCQR